ncbi:MAG: enoyl-CoA hydratase-related protein, partial [Novosphingobium sp.]|nr:enoyl-CoA hydratase-related protein [Novosphingobium sp.]
MMEESDVPVIVGVGQFVERLDDPAYRGLSPADIAAEAARAAIADTGAAEAVAPKIGIVGGIRTFEDSSPMPAPFGKPDKYTLAIARRLGLTPHTAILEKAGGNSPLSLLADVAERVRAGKSEAALIVGSEAISSVRHLSKAGEKRDWAETLDGEMEDHGRGLEGLVTRYNMTHGIQGAPSSYGLLENARRARLGMSREAYMAEMGRLFAPFSEVAAANPYSSAKSAPMSAEEIATPGERNRMISHPYTLKMVSRDQVNQGAAVLIMSKKAALAAGIDEAKLVYIHGSALGEERDMICRPDPGASSAARLTLQSALADAGKTTDDMALFDFYSCFPIPVFAAAVDGLGLAPDDPRKLTVTGGLPYFGGPGNNYSMHAIAEMSARLRARPGEFGLIGLNGGMISKYGGMVLSTAPAPWKPCRKAEIQAEIDAEPMPEVSKTPQGRGKVLTYTINYKAGEPAQGIVFGELDSGERFIANNADADTLAQMAAQDPLGRELFVTATPAGNRFAFTRKALIAALPKDAPAFRESYEYALVRRDGHVLEVTINRADQRNSLPSPAHHELSAIFDAFEADPELWVAIITGAGDKAFCAGMDLKNASSGTMPEGGFAGLTSRRTKKPVIAAVNGIAFGGGLETVLACDLAVADPSAKFGLTEVRVGVIAGAGGAVRLPRQIPRKIGVELLLTGRHMDVAEAREWGLLNRVSEPGKVMEAARALAEEIVVASPTSVRLTMQL